MSKQEGKTEKQIEGELILKLVPKCHFCKSMVGEGSRLKQDDDKYLYVCDDCRALISALIHDAAYNIFHDIANTMACPDTGYKETLESYQWGMTDEEFEKAKAELLKGEET